MSSAFHNRTILILEQLKEDPLLKECIPILASPLRLAGDLIRQSFSKSSNQLKSYRDQLDSIKLMALGLGSASRSAQAGDTLANYSLYQFAFQQFFQSSLRARQGTILDKALGKILSDNGIKTFPKQQYKNELKDIGIEFTSKHDIDVLGTSGNKYVIVQIRSRDDTGGTTAKGSLVELLEDIEDAGLFPKKDLVYLIYVWEPLNETQRQTLVNKVAAALSLDKSDKKPLMESEVVAIGNNISLGVIYGPSELFKAISTTCGINLDAQKYEKFIGYLGSWDDLWLSYATATLELDNLLIKKVSNFGILDNLLTTEHININKEDLLTYQESSANIATQLIPVWKETTIPFVAPADQANYIRDLILLKMAYIALK